MKYIGLLLFLLIFAPIISALCNNGQIDINTASLLELDNLTGIGPAKAEAIVNSRPFASVDDLIRVSGIKNATLNEIKQQGLACVSLDGINKTNKTEEENQTISQSIQINSVPEINETPKIIEKPITADVLYLNPQNPKDIKTEVNVLTSDNIAIYSLVAFCVLLGILFAVKKIKKPKTEFEIKIQT